jgi:SAM-dependent methyltransferase
VPADLKPFLPLLKSPASESPLNLVGGELVEENGTKYSISPSGIPLFAAQHAGPDARAQQAHFDALADAYIANLDYPHTAEYIRYLDRILVEHTPAGDLGSIAEICCGRGEMFRLVPKRFTHGVGVDISLRMLEKARAETTPNRILFVQGDALQLPLRPASFDCVFTLGGIHHVCDWPALFSEVFRILKPGGRFVFREPLNDFFLWQMLRYVVYRVSPALDVRERPLRRREILPLLKEAGFKDVLWRPCAFLGFCAFMNSDILVANRLFRFVPGIRGITRAAAWLDDAFVRLPGAGACGLQVVGAATKP